jgi:hypothetical protein
MSHRSIVVDYYNKLLSDGDCFDSDEAAALTTRFRPNESASKGLAIRLPPDFTLSELEKLRCLDDVHTDPEKQFRAAFRRLAQILVLNPDVKIWKLRTVETGCGVIHVDADCNATAPLRAPDCSDPNCPRKGKEVVPGTEHL